MPRFSPSSCIDCTHPTAALSWSQNLLVTTEWLQQQPGRAGHQAACPVRLFLMPSHWKLSLFHLLGLWQAHWCQADRQWLLGLLLYSHLLRGARLGLQLLHAAVKSSVDLRKGSTGGKWLEWLCPKGTLFSSKKIKGSVISDRRAWAQTQDCSCQIHLPLAVARRKPVLSECSVCFVELCTLSHPFCFMVGL